MLVEIDPLQTSAHAEEQCFNHAKGMCHATIGYTWAHQLDAAACDSAA